MDLGYAVTVIQSAVLQIIILGAPLLLIGLGVGLIVSILQATTSIQEQTLTFVPKIAAILLGMVFFGPWMIQVLLRFTVNLFQQIPLMVR